MSHKKNVNTFYFTANACHFNLLQPNLVPTKIDTLKFTRRVAKGGNSSNNFLVFTSQNFIVTESKKESKMAFKNNL